MGIKTEIAWCDSTVNPVVGCDGCELSEADQCYAKMLVARYAGLKGWPKRFNQPEFVDANRRMEQAMRWSDLTGEERPSKPWLSGRPRMIFVCDLADPFSESLPLDWLDQHVARWKDSPHVWILLTKRPQRFAQFVTQWEQRNGEQLPQSIWGGTSVTSQETVWRIGELLQVPSLSVRFLSMEPLWGSVDLTGIPTGHWAYGKVDVLSGYLCGTEPDEMFDWKADSHGWIRKPAGTWKRGECGIDWVIVGGESGPQARPMHPDWVRSIRDQCQAAGVPFLFKQWGEWMPVSRPQDADDVVFATGMYPSGVWLEPSGEREHRTWKCVMVDRVGKKAAGRLLDGREWNEIPIRHGEGGKS